MATIDEVLERQSYANDGDIWTQDTNYPVRSQYRDAVYVKVTNKAIPDFSDQVSTRGERNSQYIGFEIPRYPDGIDLTQQRLYVHYQVASEGSDSTPCNVEYSDTYIRLCWIIPGAATVSAANIQMMLYAMGSNEVGDSYTWITLPATYPIKDTLDIGGGIPEPDNSWYEQFVFTMDDKVAQAKQHATDAKASKDAAAVSATGAAKSAGDASKTLDSAKTVIAQATADAKAAVVVQGAETLASIPEEYVALDTDVKTLKKDAVRYSAQYSNALIGTVEGEGMVTMEDSAEAVMPDMSIFGKTTQVSTTGAQLFDASKIPNKTAHGATLTNNGDGSFTVSGTGNLESTFVLLYIYTHEDTVKLLKPGKYAINSSAAYPYMAFKIIGLEGDAAKEVNTSTSGTISITQDMLDRDTFKLNLLSYGIASKAIVPGTIKPMVWAKETPPTDADWEPYTGGKPSPSPEYPQELVIAGVKNKGTNLIDPRLYEEDIVPVGSNVKSTVNPDGSIKLSGTHTLTEANSLVLTRWLGEYIDSLQDGKTYSVIGATALRIKKNGAYEYMTKVTVDKSTMTSIKPYIQRAVREYKAGEICYPMLNAGNVAKPWEPYTGGRTDGDVQVQATGKNLYDVSTARHVMSGYPKMIDNGFVLKPTDNNDRIVFADCIIKKGKTYYLSFDVKSLGSFQPGDVGTFLPHGTEQYNIRGKFVANKDTTELGVYTDMKDVGKDINLEITNIQLELGDKATAYEPYQSPQLLTLPTPTGLPGIGDIQDRIICKDGVWGIACYTKKVVFDGSADEIWTQSPTNITNSWRYFIGLPSAKESHYPNLTASMCSNFPLLGRGETFAATRAGHTMSNDFMLRVYLDGRPLSEFKTWLASNPSTLVYSLATPTFEPFPADIQSQLNALHTYVSTTVITNDAGAQMQVQYVQDVNKVVAGLIARIAAMEGK